MTEISGMVEELSALWERWGSERDVAARDALVCHYLPLVRGVASRFRRWVDRASQGDLYGFGVVGLMDAIEKFRPKLGSRFESYCPLSVGGPPVNRQGDPAVCHKCCPS